MLGAQITALIIPVEHNYEDLVHMWTSQDFAGKVKVRQAPIGAMLNTAALLFNLWTWAYKGRKTVAEFQVPLQLLMNTLNCNQT